MVFGAGIVPRGVGFGGVGMADCRLVGLDGSDKAVGAGGILLEDEVVAFGGMNPSIWAPGGGLSHWPGVVERCGVGTG